MTSEILFEETQIGLSLKHITLLVACFRLSRISADQILTLTIYVDSMTLLEIFLSNDINISR